MMHAQITACFWWTCSLGNITASDESGRRRHMAAAAAVTAHADGYSCVDGNSDGHGNGYVEDNGKTFTVKANVDGNGKCYGIFGHSNRRRKR